MQSQYYPTYLYIEDKVDEVLAARILISASHMPIFLRTGFLTFHLGLKELGISMASLQGTEQVMSLV
jgi:hypothetical protein